MLKKILLAVFILIAAVLSFAATRPDTMRVERSATINAPPEKIFPYVNEFRQWALWSPFEKLDTAMQRGFGGPPSGVGSIYTWSGNKNVGKGRMEITESTPSSKIVLKLNFIEPMESSMITEFTFVPQGNTTTVTWAMYGPNSYMGKVMGMFMDMDEMIGKDFATGLQNLKTLAERP